jgi:hypothetical protein
LKGLNVEDPESKRARLDAEKEERKRKAAANKVKRVLLAEERMKERPYTSKTIYKVNAMY